MNPPRAHGPPLLRARIKERFEDFEVEEIAGSEPSGHGEHLLLTVEKRGLTTTEVARRIGRWAGVAPVAIGYAGMKDRQAVARQRFSVHLPGRPAPATERLEEVGLQVLAAAWTTRKLPRGGLAGNRFGIVLRGIEGEPVADSAVIAADALRPAVEARLARIARHGVPNRYGMQRFGRAGDNVEQARRLFAGAKVGRETRSMLLSAARASLFNRLLETRVAADCWDRAIDGEVLMLDGRRSVFGPVELDAAINDRIAAFDLHPSGPLWGRGELRSSGQARSLEAALAVAEPGLCEGLERAGLEQERRSLRLRPADFAWHWREDASLELRFRLPPGSYATALLEEIGHCELPPGDEPVAND